MVCRIFDASCAWVVCGFDVEPEFIVRYERKERKQMKKTLTLAAVLGGLLVL
jgi:hypothetical protein